MPWLLNGTLSPAERSELEAHLSDCGACRDELARQRELMTSYAATPAPRADLQCEASLARLMARIQPKPGPAAPRRRTAAWLRGWWIALAVQTSVIVGLGWSVWMLQSTTTAPAAYRGLAATDVPRATGDVVVVFDPAASETYLRRALLGAHARIVDGPTASGAYVLHIGSGAVEQAITALRKDAVVLRAEALSIDASR